MPDSRDTRWIVAFDAGCAACRKVSERVAEASDGQLEVLPLSNAEVVGWRAAALGPEPDWAPTLIRVRGGEVRAWTGRGMIAPLVRRLGVRRSVAVATAIGGARRAGGKPAVEAGGVSRKRFLQWGAGLSVAGVLAVTGELPAFASDPAAAWVREQLKQGTLPSSYGEMASIPVEYRWAVFVQAEPRVRSALFVEHLQHSRASMGVLTSEQRAVFDLAQSWAAQPSLFADREGSAAMAQSANVRERAIAAFGADQATAIFTTLGPVEAVRGPSARCNCNAFDSWCKAPTPYCDKGNCPENCCCGWLGWANCDGICE
ncbi:bacteriocin fulvocin C-related protein [Kribbella sp. NBC_01505]|uniref:bacteriocin fulvocin C-related protein n=1 Tax=Kribbella sp. NBC_01505 TaxID=2903580 RepID=UPI0038671225